MVIRKIEQLKQKNNPYQAFCEDANQEVARHMKKAGIAWENVNDEWINKIIYFIDISIDEYQTKIRYAVNSGYDDTYYQAYVDNFNKRICYLSSVKEDVLKMVRNANRTR